MNIFRGACCCSALHDAAESYGADMIMSTKRGGDLATSSRISVGLSPEHLERLEEIADAHERSVAWVVRHAVRVFLAEIDKGQLTLDLELVSKNR